MREQHGLAELGLERLRCLAFAVDRGVDQAGGHGIDADARGRQVARDRQGQADDAALGRGVGRLADLAVEGSDAGHVDDGAALAGVGVLVAAHRGGGQADAVERTDQVDGEHLLVRVEVVGGGEFAVLADGALSPSDAR